MDIKEMNGISESYPYQLVTWQETRESLNPFLENFKDEPNECAIVKSEEGYAIFTKGKHIRRDYEL